MTQGTANVTFRAFKPNEIEGELQRYCARLRAELTLPADRRKKLEAPPACCVEMPTYWKAALEPIDPEELGRYQFRRLVQDAAGTIFVAHQPSEDQAALWLRNSGQKVERKSGSVRLLVDVADFEPFETSREPSSDLRPLVDEARSLFRADVVGRGRDLLRRLVPEGTEESLPDLVITVFRNLLLEDGVEVPLPSEHGHCVTWEDDQAIESLCQTGISLPEAIKRRKPARIERGIDADGWSERGVMRSERVKDLRKEFQARRSKRLGLPRDPLDPKTRKEAARLRLSLEIDEILKELRWWARVEAGVRVARHYIDLVKEADERTISSGRASEGDFANTVGKPVYLAKAENRIARFGRMDDRAISNAFQWEPAWLETMLSGQAADIRASIEEIASWGCRFASRAAA